ncbi:hypothetical protein PR048_010434 [Dryococelus australis]|uniref:Uncharacterized protein n=1 Tax=Dryococelus australis TaxID=614101 RepID=A0ABQ9I2N9_9NEOP|nr:hypothetical protein PR048_010434 [Dryococelus australis]
MRSGAKTRAPRERPHPSPPDQTPPSFDKGGEHACQKFCSAEGEPRGVLLEDEVKTLDKRVNPKFSPVGIVPDDAAGWWVFSGISLLHRPYIPALLVSHLLSPSSTLKNWLLRAAQISQLEYTEDYRPLVHTVHDTSLSTVAQSSPFTVTADNQCTVDIGVFRHKTVEYILQVIELANFSALYSCRECFSQTNETRCCMFVDAGIDQSQTSHRNSYKSHGKHSKHWPLIPWRVQRRPQISFMCNMSSIVDTGIEQVKLQLVKDTFLLEDTARGARGTVTREGCNKITEGWSEGGGRWVIAGSEGGGWETRLVASHVLADKGGVLPGLVDWPATCAIYRLQPGMGVGGLFPDIHRAVVACTCLCVCHVSVPKADSPENNDLPLPRERGVGGLFPDSHRAVVGYTRVSE